jgi:hypothetical protein
MTAYLLPLAATRHSLVGIIVILLLVIFIILFAITLFFFFFLFSSSPFLVGFAATVMTRGSLVLLFLFIIAYMRIMCILFFFDVGHDKMGKGTKWSATLTTLAVEVEKCNSSGRAGLIT